jgi:hypothetical protein
MKDVCDMAWGRGLLSACCMMAPEYAELFPWDSGAVRILLDAMLSHYIQHNIFERPFFFLAGSDSPAAETKAKGSPKEDILGALFDSMMQGRQCGGLMICPTNCGQKI